MKWPITFSTFIEAFKAWSGDRVSRLAAELAFYTMLSLPPLFMIALAIAGHVFGLKAAKGELVSQINGLVGENAAEMIQTMLDHARKPSSSIMATLVGIVLLIVSASGVFLALQDALNTIWHVESKVKTGFLKVLQKRFFSFSMVIGIGFLLLISLVLSTLLAVFHGWLGSFWPGLNFVTELVHDLFAFFIIAVLFALIFKFVPEAKTSWAAALIGGMLTSFLFNLGKGLIGFYLGHSGVRSSYGAAGSLVVLLIWIYYSAQILFFGAEFTKIVDSKSKK